MGDWVIDSVPPAITTRSMPAMIEPAAMPTAVMPVAHWRFTAAPGVSSGRPISTAR